MNRVSILFLLVALPLAGCAQPPQAWPPGKSPRLLTSFPPIFCFVANVADSNSAVRTILKTSGPHDHQITVQDTLAARQADLFFINGLDIDDQFAVAVSGNSGNAKLEIVNLSRDIDKIKGDKKVVMHQGHSHGGEYDPHIWLGIPEAIQMIDQIRGTLKDKYPERGKAFDHNANEYIKSLKKLHEDGIKDLDALGPGERKIITFHDSLRYFTRSFDQVTDGKRTPRVVIAGVIETRPNQPPSAGEFKRLVELCKKEGVRVIAVEPQYPTDVARRLKDNIESEGVKGVQIIELDPLETALPEDFGPEHQDGKDLYVRKMERNIAELVKAFKAVK